MSLEFHDLSDSQARALLKSSSPLADVFKEWDNRETGYMEDIWEPVESCAASALQQAQEKAENNKGKARDDVR